MKPRLFYPIAVCWVCGVVASVVAVERYSNRDGSTTPLELVWPQESQLTLSPDTLTALIFAHPKCPCTQATVQEFQRIEARHPRAFDTIVVFPVTPAQEAAWRDTRLVRDAKQIQSATVVFDRGGVEARQFRCAVSGQVLLFAPDGHLLFSGGVTPARGHEGNNGGQEAFEHQVENPDSPPLTFPVFGCGLVVASPAPSGTPHEAHE